MTDHTTMKEPNFWVPMHKPVDVAVIGKLIEELNEASTACARCLIQGIDEVEPTTGKRNREWLREELADVRALVVLAERHFNLPQMFDRTQRKIEHKSTWYKMLVLAFGA